MGKHKKQSRRKARKPKRLQQPAPPAPKLSKWLLIFGVIVCAVVAGFWGINYLSRSDKKTDKKGSPPVPGEQPKPPTITSKLTIEQEIVALKKEELEFAEQLVREFPNSDDALVLIGNVYRKQGNSAEAEKYWKKALALNPARPDVYNGMGWAAFEKGEYEKAIVFWRKALEINPQTPAIHNSIAQTLILLGRYDEVIKEAEEELKISPTSGLSYFLLGQGYLKLKEYDKAKEYYETAIKLEPDYMNAYYGLFRVCSRLKLKDEAGKYLARFKELKAEDAKVLMDRNKAFDDVVVIRKMLAETYSDAEYIYYNKGNLQQAEKLLQRAVSLEPNNTEYLMKLGFLFQSSNRLQDALKMYLKAAEIEPDNMVSRLNAGVVSMQLKQYGNSEKIFREVIKSAPKLSNGYRELAHLYLMTGTNLSEALKLAKTAVALEEAAENYFILSWAYDRNGDVANAGSTLKRAVELEPDNLQYRRMYEQIQKRILRGDS
ncbi:MAG: tetratricopeptide repeat protein [Phycisphaerae bacterium]|nr:tetratricopeptide repeat protein [Phycisphaerae bacterium]NIU08850.1 tetratricopeptide repeat protein [Phycisphaerae bacterium]NIV00771.1 tetratricopeptide repeat protein [Phycisphaerae bacterium]NIV69400.1 tetratricopeptide repeat protein [Phycisphaerae bacterium]NIW96157.1 tetratricopeptide repeat protein [Phycisphaerae bacterium]